MSLDPKFRRDVCGNCRFGLFAGGKPAEGYKVQRCLYAFAHAADAKEAARTKGGTAMDAIDACPDPARVKAA